MTERAIKKMTDGGFRLAKSVEDDNWPSELEEIIACSFDGVLVADGTGYVLFANKAYERNTGIRLEDIVGHDIAELINPVWMPESVVLLTIEAGKTVSLNQFTQHKRHIVVTGTPIFDDNGGIKLVVVNTRDISEIYEMREELTKAKEMERLYYRQQESESEGPGKDHIVVLNAKMREIYRLARRICNFDTTVLIIGDSGTGKELVARFLHEQSDVRKDKAFVAVNCGAIPANLLESELFGYADGAFTGVVKGGKAGLCEKADGGTLFLDEIGELSEEMQVKILRVLETKCITRVGDSEEKHLNLRIVAATNRDLQKEVEEGRFREDLFYRLNVVTLHLPPLRERRDEIAPLALMFIQRFNSAYKLNKKFSYEVLRELEEYPWPGNIRQLKNVVEHMVVVSSDEYLHLNDVPWLGPEYDQGSDESENKSLREMMDGYEKSILQRSRKKYQSTRKMAKALKTDQSTIVRKLKKYGIT